MRRAELVTSSALTAETVACGLATLVFLGVCYLVRTRIQRDREARRQYQRREDTPAVRRLVADALEEINTAVFARRRS